MCVCIFWLCACQRMNHTCVARNGSCLNVNVSCGASGLGPSSSGHWAGNSSPCDQRTGSPPAPLPPSLSSPHFLFPPSAAAPIRVQSSQAWVIALWQGCLLSRSLADLTGPDWVATPRCALNPSTHNFLLPWTITMFSGLKQCISVMTFSQTFCFLLPISLRVVSWPVSNPTIIQFYHALDETSLNAVTFSRPSIHIHVLFLPGSLQLSLALRCSFYSNSHFNSSCVTHFAGSMHVFLSFWHLAGTQHWCNIFKVILKVTPTQIWIFLSHTHMQPGAPSSLMKNAE